jgi:hypothetical protein
MDDFMMAGLANYCMKNLQVSAAFCKYDDGDDPNAFATPEKMFPSFPHGIVAIGENMAKSFIGYANGEYRANGESDAFFLVVGHEYGHILQYRKGMSTSGPWQMEPHADFMAGWCSGRQKRLWEQRNRDQNRDKQWRDFTKKQLNVDFQASMLFGMGDWKFNEPSHHGEPEFRAAMVRAGYDIGYENRLSVDAAFEKGMKMAGLS